MFQLNKLYINPENPFPFKGDETEWQDFLKKLERDPEFMDARPIVYDSTQEEGGRYKIIAGNKRYKGLTDLGFKSVADNRVFDCKNWTPEKKRRFELADNWHPSSSEWEVDFVTEDEAEEWDIDFGEEEDYSTKNKEVDVDDFEDKMVIKLNYIEDEYRKVKDGLAKIGQTPEAAVWTLLGYE